MGSRGQKTTGSVSWTLPAPFPTWYFGDGGNYFTAYSRDNYFSSYVWQKSNRRAAIASSAILFFVRRVIHELPLLHSLPMKVRGGLFRCFHLFSGAFAHIGLHWPLLESMNSEKCHLS